MNKQINLLCIINLKIVNPVLQESNSRFYEIKKKIAVETVQKGDPLGRQGPRQIPEG